MRNRKTCLTAIIEERKITRSGLASLLPDSHLTVDRVDIGMGPSVDTKREVFHVLGLKRFKVSWFDIDKSREVIDDNLNKRGERCSLVNQKM